MMRGRPGRAHAPGAALSGHGLADVQRSPALPSEGCRGQLERPQRDSHRGPAAVHSVPLHTGAENMDGLARVHRNEEMAAACCYFRWQSGLWPSSASSGRNPASVPLGEEYVLLIGDDGDVTVLRHAPFFLWIFPILRFIFFTLFASAAGAAPNRNHSERFRTAPGTGQGFPAPFSPGPPKWQRSSVFLSVPGWAILAMMLPDALHLCPSRIPAHRTGLEGPALAGPRARIPGFREERATLLLTSLSLAASKSPGRTRVSGFASD